MSYSPTEEAVNRLQTCPLHPILTPELPPIKVDDTERFEESSAHFEIEESQV